MMHGYGHGMGASGWVVMIVAMAIFWGLVVLAAVVLLRNGRDIRPRRSGALDILEERFARGEIDREEYESRRSVLRGPER